jgi:signal transduction protein with GAF and PtsI domain
MASTWAANSGLVRSMASAYWARSLEPMEMKSASAAILIGLGVTELSAAPAAIPELKAALRELTLPACRALAAEALALTSAGEVRALKPAVPAKQGALP